MNWAIATDNTVVVARFCVKKCQKGQMTEKMAELCGEAKNRHNGERCSLGAVE